MAVTSVLVLVVCWVALAPAALGGQLSFVMVSGTSMEPTLEDGDLVVVRRASYDVGDVVAFRADGGHVIHRLHAGDPVTGWQAKGDNRSDPDSWVIRPEDVLGRQWLLVPGAAPQAASLRTPTGLGVLAAIAVTALMFPRRRQDPSARRSDRTGRHIVARDERIDKLTSARTPWTPRVPRPIEQPVLVVTLLGLFAAAAAAIAALPMTQILAADTLRISLPSAAVLAVASLLLGARQSGALGGSDVDRAYAVLRERSIQVGELPSAPDRVVIDRPQDLERIARIEGTAVLHAVDGDVHRYQVLSIGAVYEFTATGCWTAHHDGRTTAVVNHEVEVESR